MEMFGLLALSGGGGGLPPVPGSYDKAVLVGSGGNSARWEDVPYAVDADDIVAADGTTTLTQAIQAQLATWLTAAAQAPGTFTAVEGSYDFYSGSANLAAALSNLFGAVKPVVLIAAGGVTLIAVPNLIYGSVNGLIGMYFHVGGTMEVGSTNYCINGDVWATFAGVGISGFVMPTTMTQAPTLSGSYTSGTNTLNITGGA